MVILFFFFVFLIKTCAILFFFFFFSGKLFQQNWNAGGKKIMLVEKKSENTPLNLLLNLSMVLYSQVWG